MEGCSFCEIVAGRRPAHIVYEDECVTAFMDRSPLNPGHLLVVPSAHAELVGELPEKTAAHLFCIAVQLDQALRRSGLRCDGVRLSLADGDAAGQEVPHAHMHVVPRYYGDQGGRRRGAPDDREFARQAEMIRTAHAARYGTP